MTGSKATVSGSDSQDDEALLVAETQPFVLQAKQSHIKNLVCPESSGEEGDQQSAEGGSFQLGLSDSSHLQEQAQALAMESTQAFVLLQDATKGPRSSSQPALSENDTLQVCVEDNLRKGVQVNVALEATQAYISGHCSNSEDETDNEAGGVDTVEASNLPSSLTLLAMAETQPMCMLLEEDVSDKMNGKAVPLMPKSSNDQTQRLPETQPMLLIEKEENNSEDSVQLEEEQTQPLASFGLLETQPMSYVCNDEEEITEEDLPPVLQRKKLEMKEEEKEMKPATSCDVPLLETQPVSFLDDNGDSIPALQRSKSQALQLEDMQKQPRASFDVDHLETQPVSFVDDDDNDSDDDEDSLPVLRKRKARPLEQLEEEQTQPLSSCDLTLAATQPVDFGGKDEQSDEDDVVSRPRRKQTRALPSQDEETQTLVGSLGSDLSTGTQPALTGEDGDSDDNNSVIGFSKRKAKQLESQEEESQTLSLTASEKPSELADDIDESEDVESSLGRNKTKASPLVIKEDDSQSLTGPALSALGKRLSQVEAAGQGGDETSQSESRGGTSRDLGAGELKLGEEEEAESASFAETTEKQPRETSSPHEKVEMKNVEEKLQCGVSTMQKEDQMEEQQAMQIDTSNDNQHIEENEEEKIQIVKTKRKEKNVSKKGKKPELKDEKLVGPTTVQKREVEETTDQGGKEKEQLDKQNEDKEQPEFEKTEKEQKKLEFEEKEKFTSDRQAKEENSASSKDEIDPKLSARAKEAVQEKSINHQQENQPSIPAARGRRATRRTIAAIRSVEPEQHLNSDDVPARRTRSRSNSSNSVSSERSTADPDNQQSQGRGRGRGRGARRNSTVPSTSSSSSKPTTTAPPSKRNSRARSQMEVKSECTEAQVTTLASAEGEGSRTGRKRTSGADTQDVPSVSCKISKPVEEEAEEEKEAAQPNRGGRGRAKKAPVRGSPVEVKNDDVAAAGGRQVKGRSVGANQRRKDQQDVNDSIMVEPEVTCFIYFLSL